MRGGVRGGAAALLCSADALGAEARDGVRGAAVRGAHSRGGVRGAPLRGAHLLTHSRTGQ